MLNTSKRIPPIFVFIYLRKNLKLSMFFLSDTFFFTPRVYTWKRHVYQISEYFLRGNEEAARFPVHVWLHPAIAKFVSIWAGGFVRRNDLKHTRNTLSLTKFITAASNDLSVFRDRALYGIGLEPLLVDPLLLEPIHVNTSVLGYEVIRS
jgi:hypothetical protein